MHTADAHLEVRLPVKAGVHEVGVSFVRRFWEPEGVLQPPQTGFARTTNEYYHGNPAVEIVSIGGPYGAARMTDASPSRRKIFVCRPKDAAAEEPCARKILSTLAARAYRRPADRRTTSRRCSVFTGRPRRRNVRRRHSARDRTDPRRSELPVPHRTRARRMPRPAPPIGLSDLDLASRLSFFLWSSIPDDELLNAAVRGKLRHPPCSSSRCGACCAIRDRARWSTISSTNGCEMSKLSGVVPDTELFPNSTRTCAKPWSRRRGLFVASQMREDRSVVELLTADYSFLNERLARHYGDSEYLRQPFPPRHVQRWRCAAGCSARPAS